jgi:hypothetical protein
MRVLCLLGCLLTLATPLMAQQRDTTFSDRNFRYSAAGVQVRQRATKTGVKVGAVAGTIGGGALGAFGGLIVYAGCDSGNCPESLGKSVLVGTLGGAAFGLVAGAALGAVVGSALPKWKQQSNASTGKLLPQIIGSYTITPAVARPANGEGTGGGVRASFTYEAKYFALGPEAGWYTLGKNERPIYTNCGQLEPCLDTMAIGENAFHIGGVARVSTGAARKVAPFASVGTGFYSWNRAQGFGTTGYMGYSAGAGVNVRNATRTRSLVAEGRWHSNLSRTDNPSRELGYYTFAIGGAVAW